MSEPLTPQEEATLREDLTHALTVMYGTRNVVERLLATLDAARREQDELRAAAENGLDVERLAIAMSHVEVRTMAGPNQPGPQTMRDAEAIAAAYAALAAERAADAGKGEA